jgi:hypothetical protein
MGEWECLLVKTSPPAAKILALAVAVTRSAATESLGTSRSPVSRQF